MTPQSNLKWCTVHTGTDEMMQPVIRDIAIACSHGLHALVVTRSDQACNISRTHRPLRFVTQGRQKWRKPYFQIRSPVGVHRQLPLQLVLHESPIAPVGNPYSKFSAKVVLGNRPVATCPCFRSLLGSKPSSAERTDLIKLSLQMALKEDLFQTLWEPIRSETDKRFGRQSTYQ